MTQVVCVQFSIFKNAGQILAHSDWSKFEMDRSDWSRAFHHQRAPRYNPLLSLKCGADFGLILIGREQFYRQVALRVSSSFAYHVTSLWRLSSCFALIRSSEGAREVSGEPG